MKSLSFARALCCAVALFIAGTLPGKAAIKNWINTSGGSWFDPASWSPAGVPGANDAVTITNNGTYSVVAPTGTVATAVFTIGGGSGKQAFIYGTTTAFTKLGLTNSTILANGVLMLTNAGAVGALTIKSGGELQMNSGGNMQLYSFGITNQGVITWANGLLSLGDTYITNSGLFQITGNNSTSYGGGNRPLLLNSGIVRKLGGTGTSALSGIDLINLPSGSVDVQSGQLKFTSYATNVLGGLLNAASSGDLWFTGTALEAGATASGTGTIEFKDASGTFYLRSNAIPNFKLQLGDVYILGPNTFQQAGVITNLTIDGARLRGTNVVAGSLTVNAGDLAENLTIQPTGLLTLASPTISFLGSLTLINQGTVAWTGSGSLAFGTDSGFTRGTVVSNGGTWTITGNSSINFGGVGSTAFTNAGVFQKTGGTGATSFTATNFVNLPSGIIRAASGTLQMANNYTNFAGELQLAGGTLMAGSIPSVTLYIAGGKLDGFGTIGSVARIDSGVVQPGPTAASMRFQSDLVLGANCTLMLDGTGTVPGVSYDQLSVTGAVAISNCTLQVSLPTVPGGTRFVIITNNSVTPVAGTFKNLPENSPLTISGQPFHIHYLGGSGNDVVLLRDLPGGPLLFNGGYSNKTYRLSGVGNNPTTAYTIQATTNFIQWTNLGKATGDLNGEFNFIDTNNANFRYRFYRTTN